jgi:hypothetical protein
LFSQKISNDYSIYVGRVTGLSKNEFIKQYDEYNKRKDSLLNLEPLFKSKYPIEIRLYESPSLMAVETCTILFFDSTFHKIRMSKIYNGWEEEFQTKDYFRLDSIRADSTFYELVRNGIFALNEYSQDYIEVKVLTKNGFELSKPFCGSTDGCSYYIKIKVYDIYKNIYHTTNDNAQLSCTPDNNEIWRKKNIVDALRANIQFEKTKLDLR